MVLGQIGENSDGKGEPRRAVLDQSVGGGLHHHMGTALVRHLPQQLLELIAFGRGTVGGQLPLTDKVAVGADESHLGAQHPFQHLLKKAGGGGLSVGAGNRQQSHPISGPAKPVCRHQR